jgi:hypothetical protein
LCSFFEIEKQQKTGKIHKNAMKCNKTQSKWRINKHGASKIIDTFETYHPYPKATKGEGQGRGKGSRGQG